MAGEAARQPNSIIGGCATPVRIESYATFVAGADKGSTTDPVSALICPKATRVYGGTLSVRPGGTPAAIDASNTCLISIYTLTAAGAVSGAVLSKTLTAVPSTTSKLGTVVDLGDVIGTYQDVPAGGGLAIYILQGATSDISGGGVVDVTLMLGPAPDTSIVGN